MRARFLSRQMSESSTGDTSGSRQALPRATRSRLAGFWQRLREFRIIARSLLSRDRVLLAQIVPTRRCNLSCSYCTEYDQSSDPVALSVMLDRIDRLAKLGTGIVTIVGGEPLLHPGLDAIIRRIRERDMIAGLISNGFYLTPERILQLNDAGLEYLQLSIDNIKPDADSVKSLKSLDRKLEYLSQYAKFHVNINAVVGPGLSSADDALQIARRAQELGFSFSPGLLHDRRGQMLPIEPGRKDAILRLLKKNLQLYTRINNFQANLISGRSNDWHCLAGARYLYVSEDGLVHYCSPKRGAPGIPLDRYSVEHIRTAFSTPKPCAAKCNVGCVHRASQFDNLFRKLRLKHYGRGAEQNDLNPVPLNRRDAIFHRSSRLEEN